MSAHGQSDGRDDAPPFGRSWTPLYALVVANLALCILALAVLTRAFR